MGARRSDTPDELIPNRKYLFIDEEYIDQSANATRTLHQLQRHPANPVIEGSESWEYWTAYPNGRPVLYDEEDEKFKMWYLSPLVDEEYQRNIHYRTLYVESSDGVNWTKPALEIVEWDGSTENNLLPWGEQWMRRPNVIKEAHESDPRCRYKMMYADWLSEMDEPAVYKAYSEDGIHWELNADDQPLYPRHNGNLLGFDPRIDRYVRYGRGSLPDHPVHKAGIKRSTSADFESWSAYETVLTPEHDAESFHGLAAFKYHGLYLGWLWVYDRREHDMRYEVPELVVSRDGIDWVRPFAGEAVIARSASGSWDHEWIRPVAPVFHDDCIWCYYGGQNVPYGADLPQGQPLKRVQEGWTEDGQRKQRATGLATLRPDGFVSVSAPADGGWIVTSPFEFSGTALFVNVNATGGSVRVAVQDGEENPIPGFTESESVPITEDAIRVPVRWSSEATFGDLEGRNARLKINVRDADLFAFWTECTSN